MTWDEFVADVRASLAAYGLAADVDVLKAQDDPAATLEHCSREAKSSPVCAWKVRLRDHLAFKLISLGNWRARTAFLRFPWLAKAKLTAYGRCVKSCKSVERS